MRMGDGETMNRMEPPQMDNAPPMPIPHYHHTQAWQNAMKAQMPATAV